MLLRGTMFDVTTSVLAAIGIYALYLRMRNSLDSNVPILFYGIMTVYTNQINDPRLPPWIIYLGFVLTLILRFEFLNETLTRALKAVECLVLAAIIYDALALVLRW